VSNRKEPYRLEGKKTMGYEVAEQFDWKLPDVIAYPTEGGTGLVGMWKPSTEMEEMGLIEIVTSVTFNPSPCFESDSCLK
jgi:threonine synthase